MTLLHFVLACYGTTAIVTQGRIFRRGRKWLQHRSALLGAWIQCPMCFGVPVGATWALAGLGPGTGLGTFGEACAAGAISSGVCWILRVCLAALGEDHL